MANEPPKTADGVEIVEGMTVWRISTTRTVERRTVGWISANGCVYLERNDCWVMPDSCYASKERAEAALKLHVGD